MENNGGGRGFIYTTPEVWGGSETAPPCGVILTWGLGVLQIPRETCGGVSHFHRRPGDGKGLPVLYAGLWGAVLGQCWAPQNIYRRRDDAMVASMNRPNHFTRSHGQHLII